MNLELRPYQLEAIEHAREALRAGARNVLICAPTGAGKTVIASHLINESRLKGLRSAFVVDRLSLIDQTSEVFDRHGIPHGVLQATHWRCKPSELVQLCSAQTLARRGWPAAKLIVVDEAHTVTETVRKRIEGRQDIAIGLTATPFTKGLGRLYDVVINVTTTNSLIRQGFLAPFRIFSCTEPDMTGVSVTRHGEWDSHETEQRALQVVGDVVLEYLKHGENRKFICSAVDTAHVNELQRQFLAAGIHAATYTYKDRDEDRTETLIEYRKTDSSIRGLITVTAASKGFDVPDIGCVIMARPLRRSLAEHIQFFGRGLRTSGGKTDCLVLDHSGNCARFWHDTQDFFANGVAELDDGSRQRKAKRRTTDVEPVKCPQCRAIHSPAPFCPQCGHEYPRRQSVEHVPGTLKELIATGDPALLRRELWPQVVSYVLEGGEADLKRAQRRAQAIYRELTGEFAHAHVESTVPEPCSAEVRNKIRSNTIRWARSPQRVAA